MVFSLSIPISFLTLLFYPPPYYFVKFYYKKLLFFIFFVYFDLFFMKFLTVFIVLARKSQIQV